MTELSEVCLAVVDCEHKTAPKSEDGYPLIRTTDIGRGRLDLTNVQRVDEAAYEEWTRRAVPQPGDLILAREAPVGNVAMITPGLEVVLGQRTVLIRPDPELVDPDFLCYRLLAHDIQHWMSGVANGATVPHLNMEDIRSLPLPALPPLTLQRMVGQALGSIDDLIENNRRRMEILEETARLIHREWFVHFRFPGYEEVEFVDSDLGTIPAGWHTVTLGAVANVNERSLRTGDPAGEILYLDISSVGPRTIEAPEAMEFSSAPGRARRLVAAGDTVWSTVRPNRRSHALLVDPPPNLVCSTGFAVLTPRTVPSSYLFELTSTDEFTAHLTGLATGSAYPAVRPADFECYPVALPPGELLDQYDTVVGQMHRLQHALSEQNRLLSAARDLLLPRLISGELDVSDLDLNLEPAA